MRVLTVTLAALLGACTSEPSAPPDLDAATVVILVRHAEKAVTDDPDPPLTEAGQARALALADALADAGVDVIVGSQFRRTTETVEPLADRLGVEVETRSLDGDPGEAAAAVARDLAREHAGRTVLIAGHSNTIPAMVNALTGLSLPDLDETDYDGLYTVVLDGTGVRLVRGQVGAPDPVPEAG